MSSFAQIIRLAIHRIADLIGEPHRIFHGMSLARRYGSTPCFREECKAARNVKSMLAQEELRGVLVFGDIYCSSSIHTQEVRASKEMPTAIFEYQLTHDAILRFKLNQHVVLSTDF